LSTDNPARQHAIISHLSFPREKRGVEVTRPRERGGSYS